MGSVLFNGAPHAMVLDTIKNGEFVFKNTNSDNTQFRIAVDHPDSPDKFYFLQIELERNFCRQIMLCHIVLITFDEIRSAH